jgi:hypothetical protein
VGGAHRLRRPEILAELAADLPREHRVVDRSQLPLPPLFVGRERVLGFPPSPSAVEVEDSPWRGEGRGEGALWLSVELLTCPKPSTHNVSRDSLFLLRRSPQRDTVRRTSTATNRRTASHTHALLSRIALASPPLRFVHLLFVLPRSRQPVPPAAQKGTPMLRQSFGLSFIVIACAICAVVRLGVAAPQSNDTCSTATTITSNLFFPPTLNTTGANASTSEPQETCEFQNAGVSNTVWYRFTPDDDGTATINTEGSNYDTVLAVFTSCSGGTAAIACNDDVGFGGNLWSQLPAVPMNAGTTYRIKASDWHASTSGSFGDGGNLDFNFVFISTARPDLVADINALDEPWEWGQQVSADFEVENIGRATAAQSVAVLVMSPDSTIDEDDYAIETFVVPSLAAGAVHNWNDWTWTLPQSRPSGFPTNGPVYFGLIADRWNEIFESDETNNTDDDQVAVSLPAPPEPDLSASIDALNERWQWGESISADLEIQNGGRALAPQSVAVLVMSPDSTIDNNDYAIETFIIPQLASGTAHAWNWDWTLPSSPPMGFPLNGTVHFGLIGDYWDEVSEADETNNTDGDAVGVTGSPVQQPPAPPIPPSYPPPPPLTQDKLVVVTHGWNTTSAVYDSFWLPFTAQIPQNVGNDWDVVPYNWTSDSGDPFPQFLETGHGPDWALSNAIGHGYWLAEQVGRRYSHVHLIAHSAGSAFIAAAAHRIKQNSPSTTIHTTFLDAFAGTFIIGGISNYQQAYGANSVWSDYYRSLEVSNIICLLGGTTTPFTQLTLPLTHRVDVTFVDPEFDPECLSSHTWPRCFYEFTVPGPSIDGCGEAQGNTALSYGFALSWESVGGDKLAWINSVNSLHPINTGVTLSPNNLAGSQDNELVYRIREDQPMILRTLPSVTSSANAVAVVGASFTAQTLRQDPASAWVNFEVTTNSVVNCLAFDIDFTSVPSATGLMSLFVNGVQRGVVDEAFAQSGIVRYRMPTPGDLLPGTHIVSFRLDQIGTIPSSISVANVATGRGAFVSPGDVNVDDSVDVDDLIAVILAWGVCPAPPATCLADVDGNGQVDVDDLIAVILNWG